MGVLHILTCLECAGFCSSGAFGVADSIAGTFEAIGLELPCANTSDTPITTTVSALFTTNNYVNVINIANTVNLHVFGTGEYNAYGCEDIRVDLPGKKINFTEKNKI